MAVKAQLVKQVKQFSARVTKLEVAVMNGKKTVADRDVKSKAAENPHQYGVHGCFVDHIS